MSQRKLSVEVNKFNKGIVGSASPVDFPIDAASVMKNFVIEKDGSLRKRGGLYTAGELVSTTAVPSDAGGKLIVGVHNSFFPDGDALIVTDIYEYAEYVNPFDPNNPVPSRALVYYKADFSSDPVSFQRFRGPALYASVGQPINPDTRSPTKLISSAVIGPSLVLTSCEQDGEPFVMQLDFNGVDFILNTIGKRILPEGPKGALAPTVYEVSTSLLIRDSWTMLPSTFSYTSKSSATAADKYNAVNQGYYGTTYQAIESNEVVPGISQSAALALVSGGKFEMNKAGTMYSAPRGNMIQSYGKFVRNFERDGTIGTVSAGDLLWGGLEVNCIASSGRAFYWSSGGKLLQGAISSDMPPLDNMILFSSLSSGLTNRLTTCHSLNNPTGITGEDTPADSSPLETDGGVIIIDNSGRILKLVEYEGNLIVFAANGVWYIRSPFSPISYSVIKLSDHRLSVEDSVVSTPSAVLFFTDNGVNAITKDLRAGILTVSELSQPSLSNMFYRYRDAMLRSPVVRACYDPSNGTVVWLHLSDDSDLTYNEYTSLVYDMDLGAFYEKYYNFPKYYTVSEVFSDNTSSGLSIVAVGNSSSSSHFIRVFREGEEYTEDRLSLDGTVTSRFSATLETGAASFGDASKAKNAPYISLYFKQTEGSYDNVGELENQTSCLMQVKWDFSRSADTGKWTDEREMYRLRRFTYPDTQSFDYGYDVVVTKNKIRGRGKAMRLKLTVPEGKVCHLYGWNFTLMANSEV